MGNSYAHDVQVTQAVHERQMNMSPIRNNINNMSYNYTNTNSNKVCLLILERHIEYVNRIASHILHIREIRLRSKERERRECNTYYNITT